MTLTLRRTLAVLTVGLAAADPALAQRGGRPGGGSPGGRPGGAPAVPRGGPPGGGGRSMPPPAARPLPSSGQRSAAPVPRSLPPAARPQPVAPPAGRPLPPSAATRGRGGYPGPGGDFRRGGSYPSAAGGLPGPITNIGGSPRPGGPPAVVNKTVNNTVIAGRPGGFPGAYGYGFPRYGGYGVSPYGFGGFPRYGSGFGYPGYGYGGSGFGAGFGVGTAVGLLGSYALGGFGGVPFGGFGYGGGGGLAVAPAAYRPVYPLVPAGGFDVPPLAGADPDPVLVPLPSTPSSVPDPAVTSPDYPTRAVALVAAGRYDEAVAAFQHAAVDNPRDGRLALQAARALAAAGRYDEAAGAAQQGLALLPPEEWVAAIRGTALDLPSAAAAEAVRAGVRAAADKPGAAGAKFLAGVLAAGAGHATKAALYLTDAAALAPQDQVAKRLVELLAAPR